MRFPLALGLLRNPVHEECFSNISCPRMLGKRLTLIASLYVPGGCVAQSIMLSRLRPHFKLQAP
jgi:hypothetical protein